MIALTTIQCGCLEFVSYWIRNCNNFCTLSMEKFWYHRAKINPYERSVKFGHVSDLKIILSYRFLLHNFYGISAWPVSSQIRKIIADIIFIIERKSRISRKITRLAIDTSQRTPYCWPATALTCLMRVLKESSAWKSKIDAQITGHQRALLYMNGSNLHLKKIGATTTWLQASHVRIVEAKISILAQNWISLLHFLVNTFRSAAFVLLYTQTKSYSDAF